MNEITISAREDLASSNAFELYHDAKDLLKPANVSPLRMPFGIELFVNAFVIVAASVISGIGYHWIALNTFGNGAASVATGLASAAIFCGMMRSMENAHPLGITTAARRARDASLAWIFSCSLLLSLIFTLRLSDELSRGAIWTFFGVGLAAVVALHVNIPILRSKMIRAHAIVPREVILIAPHGDATLGSLAAEMRSRICVDPAIVRFDANCDSKSWPNERRVLRAKVFDLARSLGCGEVFVTTSQTPLERLNAVLSDLALLPRAIFVVPDKLTGTLLRHRVTAMGRTVAVQVQNEPLNASEHVVKRAIDLLLASILLVFIAPLLVAIAIILKLDSPGPVLFLQRRTGYRGRSFKILKFRTMTVQEDGPTITQAETGDKRFTRVGRWLRKRSLDELPQLINVIKGEMSLVGPRPHALAHDAFYSKTVENYELRQHVVPGITGWAQVNGFRGETTSHDLMRRRIEHDLWYVTSCSIWLDLQILARTVVVLLCKDNAY